MNYKNEKISGEKYLSTFLKRNYSLITIFDVGAHHGDYTNLFVETDASIYCFEPNPSSFNYVQKRFHTQKNVNLFNMGLSSKGGESQIFDYKNLEGSYHASMYKEVFTHLHNSMPVSAEIRVETVDHFSQENGIERINLLKIDTEGHELEVLKGAQSLIDKKCVDVIHFEFNEMNVISRIFLMDFFSLLHSYNLYRLLPNDFLPINYKYPHKIEFFAFQNIVAFRKEIDKISNK